MRRAQAPGRLKGTFPYNSTQLINPNGAITGYYVDSVGALHGFVRDENGVITTFDAPGAGTANEQGTQSFAISPNGEITGFYFDNTKAYTAFCGTRTASSPHSIYRAREQVHSRVPMAAALLRMEAFWESSLTETL